MLDKESKKILESVHAGGGIVPMNSLTPPFDVDDILWLVNNHYLYSLSSGEVKLASPARIYLQHYWRDLILRWLPLAISLASFALAFSSVAVNSTS